MHPASTAYRCGVLPRCAQIGKWCRLENHCVLGEDVQVKGEVALNGATVLPHKEVKENVSQPTIIL